MRNRKEKEKKKTSLAAKLKLAWSKQRTSILFVSLFALYMIIFYIIWLSNFFNDHFNPRIEAAYAFLGSKILNIFHQQTTSFHDAVNSPFFAIKINRGCDAIEATALFVAALLAFPAKWNNKMTGIIKGVFLIFCLNLIRIVSLFLVGRYHPQYFDFVHVEVWQIIFIIFSLGLWMNWAKHQPSIKLSSEK